MGEWLPALDWDEIRAEWRTQALCAQVGYEPFFADVQGQQMREAKRICAMCPVRAECLEFAMRIHSSQTDHTLHGVWAGTTYRDRIRIANQRTTEAA